MNHWTDEEIEKMKSAYYQMKTVKCPQCDNKVNIEKQEGEKYLKKKYVNTHLFLKYSCTGCERWTIKTYRMG